MAPRVPLERLIDFPAQALSGLRLLPSIARNTEAMEENTALLHEVTKSLERVARDTRALPALRPTASTVDAPAARGR